MSPLLKTIEFLNEIGIKASFGTISDASFLKTVEIRDGDLIISDDCPLHDILHEAGHVALIPQKFRILLNGSVYDCAEKIYSQLSEYEKYDVDNPPVRSLIHASDTEATAWAWAAGKYLDIPNNLIIPPCSYEMTGNSIRLCLELNQYLGIHGLKAAGFMKSVRQYPRLDYWTQI